MAPAARPLGARAAVGVSQQITSDKSGLAFPIRGLFAIVLAIIGPDERRWLVSGFDGGESR